MNRTEGQNRPGRGTGRTEQNRTEENRTKQDRREQNRKGQDRREQNRRTMYTYLYMYIYVNMYMYRCKWPHIPDSEIQRVPQSPSRAGKHYRMHNWQYKYVRICICICTRICTRICIRIFTCTCTCIDVNGLIYPTAKSKESLRVPQGPASIIACITGNINMYEYVYVYVHVYVHVYVYVYLRVHVHV